MHEPPVHPDPAEQRRLTALGNMAILDTAPQPDFDQITRLAAFAFGTMTAAITLIDDRRAWFKSGVCVGVPEVPRDHAFCTLALQSTEPLIVLDTQADPRFDANPLAQGPDGYRFYVGAPLVISSGECLGTLCVADPQPRTALATDRVEALVDLARLVVELIEARRYRQIGEMAAQVIDATADAVLCADEHGRITFWNRAAERMFGHTAAAAMGRNLDIIVPGSLAAAHRRGFARAAGGGETHLVGTSVELTARHADDTEFPIELSLARWGGEDGGFGFAGIIRDASARKMLEREREDARAFLNTIVDNLPAMLFVKDVSSREYLLINRAGEKLTGRSLIDVVGRTDPDLFGEQGIGYEQRDAAALVTEGVSLFESDFHRPNGEVVTLRTQRIVVGAAEGRPRYIMGMSEDVTETRRAQAEVLRLAQYDSLTGLFNRGSFVTRLGDLVQSGATFALLSIDLDRFKAVNDQFGHLAGDEVLARVSERLCPVARPIDILARVGGDEFALIITGDDAADRARMVAATIIQRLAAPIPTTWATVTVGGSIGIVIAPHDGETGEGLRQCADLALYRAKKHGRGSVCVFSAEMDAATRDRRALERDLRQALDDGQIRLAYQPVLSAQTRRITSVEALARWDHPGRGAIPPDLFISIAEESGMIERLGQRILCIACAEALTWPDHVPVAVNVSPMQIHSGDLCATVRQVLADTGLPPHRLQLEVTEGLFLRDVDHTFGELAQLRALGIQILMDDFGIGYSSLSYFERFHFDKVKIDKSFVGQMLASRAAGAIIQAVVGLGRALDMGVVAEGVETEEQMHALIAAGCTHLQGFLFAQPVSNVEIGRLLADPMIDLLRSRAA